MMRQKGYYDNLIYKKGMSSRTKEVLYSGLFPAPFSEIAFSQSSNTEGGTTPVWMGCQSEVILGVLRCMVEGFSAHIHAQTDVQIWNESGFSLNGDWWGS